MRTVAAGILEFKTEFCCNNNSVTIRLQGFSEQLLVGMRIIDSAVNLGSVKESITHIDRIINQSDHIPFICRSAVSVTHTHAAKSDGRYSQTTQS